MKLQAAPQDDWEVSDLSSQSQPNVTSSPSAASCSQPPPQPILLPLPRDAWHQVRLCAPDSRFLAGSDALNLGRGSVLASLLGWEELLSCKAIWQPLLGSCQRQSSSEECVLVSPAAEPVPLKIALFPRARSETVRSNVPRSSKRRSSWLAVPAAPAHFSDQLQPLAETVLGRARSPMFPVLSPSAHLLGPRG